MIRKSKETYKAAREKRKLCSVPGERVQKAVKRLPCKVKAATMPKVENDVNLVQKTTEWDREGHPSTPTGVN